MHRRVLTLVFLLLALPIVSFAQGTRSILRCAFNGSLEIRASEDPGSPVIGRVACGATVQLLDNRFGAPHIRTEDGKDGYITGSTLGWAVEPGTVTTPLTPAQSLASRQGAGKDNHDSHFRRFEIGYMPASYWRDSGADYAGGNLSFVVNANEKVGIVAQLDAHRDLLFSTTDVFSYTLGVRSYILRKSSVTGFVEAGFGGVHATDGINSNNGYSQRMGGALDLNIRPWIHWRMIEVDHTFIHTSGNNSNGVQLATGLAFRFGHD